MFTDSYGNVRFPGAYRGIVADAKDPLEKGRLRLRVPQVLGDAITDWAWGSYKPGVQTTAIEVGTGVWVSFEGGDPSFPIWNDGFDSTGSVDYVQLNSSYTVGSQKVGQLTWNTEDETPEVKVGNGEVTLQIGQEFHARASNTSGTTIPNGTLVYYNGDIGVNGHASVRPYLADGTISAFKVVGITTQEIPVGGDGLVTIKGKVRDLDTSMYAVGDVLYASPLFVGELTAAQPTPPDEVVVVAVVTAVSATAGEVTVNVVPVINQLTTNITLYQTNVASDIGTYFKAVNSQSDASYNNTAVSIPVPSGSLGGSVGSTVVLSSFAAPANLFTGDPGAAVTVTTSGNIMKTSGNNNTQALFFFTVYKRTSGGTETLLGTSSQTGPAANVTHNIWQQFSANAVVTLGTFTSTDRIVIKFHAYIAQSGTQAYAFQFGGLTPVRTLIPVPVSVISTSPAIGVSVDTTNFNNNLSSSDKTVQLALDTLDEIPISTIQSDLTTLKNRSFNYLINGAFDFWQRGTSSTVSGEYLADRWYHNRAAGTHTVSRSTDVPSTDFPQYSLSFASTSGTNPGIYQYIESNNSIQFAGKEVTISIWAKSTVGTGGLSWQSSYPTTVDDWTTPISDTSGVFAASMTVGTWVRYTATFTANALATRGYRVRVYRNVTTTSTTTLYAGAQLELGGIATPFRRNAASIQGELDACLRYYENYNSTTGAVFPTGTHSTTTARFMGTYNVEKRVNPAISISGGADTLRVSEDGTDSQISSAVCTVTGNTKRSLAVEYTGTFVIGRVSYVYMGQSATGLIQIDAELS
jgi:hypothetical protein